MAVLKTVSSAFLGFVVCKLDCLKDGVDFDIQCVAITNDIVPPRNTHVVRAHMLGEHLSPQ
jgi:hypothetical protein